MCIPEAKIGYEAPKKSMAQEHWMLGQMDHARASSFRIMNSY